MSEKSNKEEKKVQIKEQIEYYLSDKNLQNDSFFHNKISEDPNGYLDLDLLLKCNKIKNAGWTIDEIKEGIKLSEEIELDKEEKKVRRKDNKALPELVLLNKKRKKEKKNEEEKGEEEKEPVVLMFTCKEPNESKWKDVCKSFQDENEELDVIYKRFKDTTGHIVIRPKDENEIKFKDKFKCDDIEYEVKKCEGDDLINFYKDYGEHYQMCIKNKDKKNKNKKYKNKKSKK